MINQVVGKIYGGYIDFPPHPIHLEDLADSIGVEMEEQESIREGFSHEMFKYIYPGKERACVIMVADGYEYKDIAWILGIREFEVGKIMHNVRQRLIKAKIGVRYYNPRDRR